MTCLVIGTRETEGGGKEEMALGAARIVSTGKDAGKLFAVVLDVEMEVENCKKFVELEKGEEEVMKLLLGIMKAWQRGINGDEKERTEELHTFVTMEEEKSTAREEIPKRIGLEEWEQTDAIFNEAVSALVECEEREREWRIWTESGK